MKAIVTELQQLIETCSAKFRALPVAELEAKPLPNKWSKKEIIGHLTDSAHNNLRRFIVGQYETPPPHLVYDQDFWVAANAYQAMPANELITLWTLINLRICAVLHHMPSSAYTNPCNTGKGAEELHSLEWLATDYISHLKHHLRQVIPDFNTLPA